MDFLTTIMVLCAAVLHATWNALVKGGRDPLYDAAGMSVAWLVLCIVGIPFFPAPDLAVWPYVLVSLVVHTGYLYFLSRSYSIGDFSAVYPVMRGLPPVLVSVAGMFLAGEVLPLAGGLGVVAVSCGILVLEIGKKGTSRRLFMYAFATACMIAAYTVSDGLGARVSGNSFGFILWLTLFQSLTFLGFVMLLGGRQGCMAHIRAHWKRGVASGTISLAAYTIVLWAMTRAPIAYVSATRETSVLFAGLIGALFLSEPLQKKRIFSAAIILCGIILIKAG